MTKDLKDYLLDMVYPKTCPVCRKIPDKGTLICKSCEKKLSYIKEPQCMKCSKPILDKEKEYCYDCQEKAHSYIAGKALWIYDDTMRRSIAGFKYGGSLEYAQFYGRELARHYGKWIKAHGDILVPVPLHRKKKRIRGYNQAEVLAREVGKRVQVPVAGEFLCRTKATLPQKELNDKERLKNLSQAFAVEKNHFFTAEKVMLVDDIYTTGSTIEACAKVLYKAGIKEVYFLSICIGKGF